MPRVAFDADEVMRTAMEMTNKQIRANGYDPNNLHLATHLPIPLPMGTAKSVPVTHSIWAIQSAATIPWLVPRPGFETVKYCIDWYADRINLSSRMQDAAIRQRPDKCQTRSSFSPSGEQRSIHKVRSWPWVKDVSLEQLSETPQISPLQTASQLLSADYERRRRDTQQADEQKAAANGTVVGEKEQQPEEQERVETALQRKTRKCAEEEALAKIKKSKSSKK
ncbi:MAG: hypothetical protein Q9184_004924 [Pyrenodesmia sp. 2 TL-2023]